MSTPPEGSDLKSSPPDEEGPAEAPTTAPEAPALEHDTTATPSAEGDTEGAEDADKRGGNLEAAKYRRRLREAEAERDMLAQKLSTAEQSVISYAIERAGIDPRLWALSEVATDDMRTEAGQLDIGKLIERATAIRREVYGVGPQPNPQQGTPSQGPPLPGLASAFDPRDR